MEGDTNEVCDSKQVKPQHNEQSFKDMWSAKLKAALGEKYDEWKSEMDASSAAERQAVSVKAAVDVCKIGHLTSNGRFERIVPRAFVRTEGWVEPKFYDAENGCDEDTIFEIIADHYGDKIGHEEDNAVYKIIRKAMRREINYLEMYHQVEEVFSSGKTDVGPGFELKDARSAVFGLDNPMGEIVLVPEIDNKHAENSLLYNIPKSVTVGEAIDNQYYVFVNSMRQYQAAQRCGIKYMVTRRKEVAKNLRYVENVVTGWYWCNDSSVPSFNNYAQKKIAIAKTLAMPLNQKWGYGYKTDTVLPMQVKAAQSKAIKDYIHHQLTDSKVMDTSGYWHNLKEFDEILEEKPTFMEPRRVKYLLTEVSDIIWTALVGRRNLMSSMTGFVNSAVRHLCRSLVYCPSGEYFVDPNACAMLLQNETRLSRAMLDQISKGKSIVDAFVTAHSEVKRDNETKQKRSVFRSGKVAGQRRQFKNDNRPRVHTKGEVKTSKVGGSWVKTEMQC